jgi:hypothetical protein
LVEAEIDLVEKNQRIDQDKTVNDGWRVIFRNAIADWKHEADRPAKTACAGIPGALRNAEAIAALLVNLGALRAFS